jgi:phosphopantetheine adenylyltransferase
MNGESKRSFALVLASFAIGAIVVGVLGDPKVREKISESSKNLMDRTKKLAEQVDLA